MGESLVAMGPAVANHLWQSTAFAAVAWAVAWLLRKNQARVRYAVWLAASVKFLAPFALLISLGGMLPRPKQAVVAMPVYSAVDEVGMPFDEVQGTGIGEQRAEESSQLSVLGSQIKRGMPEVLVGVWLGGVVTVLAVWWVRWRQVAGTLRRAVGTNDGREAELLREVERKMGARVRLVLSGELMEPGVFGVVRPVLIWPERLSQRLDDEHVEAILAHELMHVRRCDNLTAALHMLVEAAFWFHPAVWWLGARLVEERERACDEAVVEMGSRPGVYAEGLLKAVRFCVESPLKCVAGVTGADLKQRVRSIMTLRLERLGWGRKLVLALVAAMTVAVPVLLGQGKAAQRMMLAAVNAAPQPVRAWAASHAMIELEETPATGLIAEVQAQGQAPSPPQQSLDGAPDESKPFRFDVVSIRPTKPGNQSGPAGLQFTGDGLQASNLSLSMMLTGAYQQQLEAVGQRILRLPDWAKTETFDVKAKVADSDTAEWGKLSQDMRGPAQERKALSLLQLLTEQFKLKTHSEIREGPIYSLVVAKGGPKLKESKSDDPPSFQMKSPGHLSYSGTPMETIVRMCAQMTGRQVVDKTGLTGRYDFTLDWTQDQGAPAPAAAPGSESRSSELPVFTVVQEQLGLKLEPEKGPVEYIVVDHAEKPGAMDGAEVPAPGDPKQVLHGAYKVWLDQDVRWIVTDREAEAFKQLTNDEERDKFIEQFWQRRNPNPDAAGNAYKAEIYARIAYANEHFAESQPGWSTDRGHVYIVYGKPDEVDVPVGDWTETWRYRHMAGVGDNIVLKFGFVAMGARRHVLVPPLPAGLFGRGTDPTPAPTRDGKTVTNGAPAADQTPNPLKRRLADVERARGEAFGGARTVLQGAAGASRVQDGGPVPAFDVASIHLAAPSPDGHHHIWNDVHQSQFRTGNLSVRDLIQYAYGLPKSQILGGPDWLDSAMFDIDAKSDPSVDAELHGLSSDDAAQQKRRMVQALLADRFALTAHKETRQLPVFALVLAKGGPKFKPAQVNGTTIDTYPSRLHISGSDDTVAVLARELAQSLGRVVLNQTGLIGRYDLTLSWTPDDRPAPTVNGAPDPNAPPGLFTAIQEQLGLKLESTKAPVDVLVIDRVERPSEN
jgi:uncharacterized protein (TIGR03435 family)